MDLANRIMQGDRAWMPRANCRGVKPDLFFPAKGESVSAAKRVCAACEVTEECLEYAIVNQERWGIWGGLSEKRRKPLRVAYWRERRAG